MTDHHLALAALRRHLRGRLALDRATRLLYATDASLFRCEPAGVFWPRDEEDLVLAMRLAAEHGLPLVPRGAGTSLSGQAISPGLVVDLSHWRGLRVDAASRRCIAGPGVVIDAIDRAAAPHGLRYGPAPASSNRATLAGVLGNNGTGPHSIRFGMAETALRRARLLLSDGTIREFREDDLDDRDPLTARALALADRVQDSPRWPRTWRNASGYNLRAIRRRNSLLPLLAGSEGTLGVLLEIEVELVERPRQSLMALFFYDEMLDSLRAVPALLASRPAAIELMDRRLLELAQRSAHFRMPLLEGADADVLVVEYLDDPAAADKARSLGARHVITDPAAQAGIWQTRKEGLGILMASRAARKPVPFIEDCAVAVEALPEYVERLDRIIRANGTESAYYAHASAGCLHIRPLLDLHDAADVERMKTITAEAVALLVELGGTLTGEHGDGRAKRPYWESFYGAELNAAFRELQAAFDPAGILAASDEGELRTALPVRRRFRPALEWPSDFTLEVERCNGEGACRKQDGVMCPSFQATGDEALLTRGRANLLRAWLAGENVTSELDETLKRCLACKACSAECPSQVDMSAFKADFLAHRPPGVADLFFARFALLSALGRVFGVPFQGIVKKAIGIHPRCVLPVAVRAGFAARHRGRVAIEEADVILFVDTHVEYYEPEIGLAFMKLCETLGIKAHAGRFGCCSRPAYSRGRLKKARADLRRIRIPGSCPVVVIEPSCCSMLKEDAPGLLPEMRPLAARVTAPERFLLRYEEQLARLTRGRPRPRVFYHGHCHEKAAERHLDTARLLRLVCDVTEIDAGCCGMAGAFGYEEENYLLAEAIAEERFLPALRRGRAEGARLAASGRSCREMATRHGLTTEHPLQVLASALGIG